jgi:hypothetical protein
MQLLSLQDTDKVVDNVSVADIKGKVSMPLLWATRLPAECPAHALTPPVLSRRAFIVVVGAAPHFLSAMGHM